MNISPHQPNNHYRGWIHRWSWFPRPGKLLFIQRKWPTMRLAAVRSGTFGSRSHMHLNKRTICHRESQGSTLTCILQVHPRQLFGEFTGAGRHFALPCDVRNCVPAACAITVDEVWVRRLNIHHLSMTSALITPANRGGHVRWRVKQMDQLVLPEWDESAGDGEEVRWVSVDRFC